MLSGRRLEAGCQRRHNPKSESRKTSRQSQIRANEDGGQSHREVNLYNRYAIYLINGSTDSETLISAPKLKIRRNNSQKTDNWDLESITVTLLKENRQVRSNQFQMTTITIEMQTES